jgi:hypothetical protein
MIELGSKAPVLYTWNGDKEIDLGDENIEEIIAWESRYTWVEDILKITNLLYFQARLVDCLPGKTEELLAFRVGQKLVPGKLPIRYIQIIRRVAK